jgi:hypothetical protein
MGLALLVGAAIPLAPLVRDDWALDAIVRAVALDLRDFGEARARERLRFEIAAQGLQDRLDAETCDLDVGASSVSCAWGVVLTFPVVERSVPLAFSSAARTTSTGDLQ